MISTQPSIQTLAEEARCPQCGMTRDERAAYSDNCPMRVPSIGCPFFDAKEKAMTPNARDKELAEETARERYNDCLDPANVPQDARVVDAIEQALAKQREAQFSWLFSHCPQLAASDLPQCHPTWTECPLCHNDIKRMPEGCQFKPSAPKVEKEAAGMVSVPREPTDAMVDAGAELCLHGQDVYRLREIYKAMLAAGAKE